MLLNAVLCSCDKPCRFVLRSQHMPVYTRAIEGA